MEQQNIKTTESNAIENECVDIERLIDNLTLFDDDLMSRVFERNVEATELVLGIILHKPIRVVRRELSVRPESCWTMDHISYM